MQGGDEAAQKCDSESIKSVPSSWKKFEQNSNEAWGGGAGERLLRHKPHRPCSLEDLCSDLAIKQ